MNKLLKVVLINAPSLGIIEPWMDAPEFGRASLAYLAGYLRQSSEIQVSIVDAKLERKSFQDVINQIKILQPDVIGYTAFTNEIKPCAYLAYKIKAILPDCLQIIGGAHVTALPKQTLAEFCSFDIACIGEGELTFSELCDAILKGESYAEIPGLVYRVGDQMIQTKARERLLEQDLLPMPAWDLMPKANVYWIQSQRGCPFKCVFCMNHNGRVARKANIMKVADEIEYVIDKFQPEWIRFGDELFTVDMDRTMDLLDEMIKRGIGKRVKWDVQTHVNYVNYEMFVKFKEAGCTQIDLGVETGDEALLKTMGKGTNHEKIIKAFVAAKKAGVTTGSFFLFGQPNESVSSILKTIKFAVKLNPDIPMFGMMVPFPGTKVAKLAAENKEGFLDLSYDWDEYRKQIGGAVTFAKLSRNQAEFLQLIGYVAVFLLNLRFIDFLKFLFKYRNEAWSLFVKIITLQKGVDYKLKKPADYDRILNGEKIVAKEMVASFDDFDLIQKEEIVRTKKIMPSLFKEQTPR